MPASDSLTIKPRLLCKRNNYEIYGKVTKTSYIIANTNIVPIKLLQKLYNTFPESIIVFEQECFKVMRCEFILNASCCIKIINDYKIFQKQSTSNNILLVDDELNDLCIKYKTVFIILTSNLEIHDNNLWKCQILLKSRWPITKLKVAVSTPDYEDIASSILQIVGFVTCIISDRENDCKGIINLDCTGSIDELILIELGLNNFQVKNVLREFKSAYDFINCSKSTKLRILDGNLAQVDSLCKLLSSDFPQVRAL
ncbi:Zip2p SCDLUD_002254 [Saccharomycodes ludwigii]|uniref:Zip2p n=1 Tax=Saccharomycodes ludwigii TaxID=36035 RepID=UPI001E853B67|nr:hypothetical protein SCDLUD_002254 [Saccharomycodes ludwigii]KAH3900801.1 hypothetical protein SCDLUD_002254 [Saccharomycodes ludwigii]